MWWLDALKENRENSLPPPKKKFWTKEKETGLEIQPRVTANRPLNNLAKEFSKPFHS